MRPKNKFKIAMCIILKATARLKKSSKTLRLWFPASDLYVAVADWTCHVLRMRFERRSWLILMELQHHLQVVHRLCKGLNITQHDNLFGLFEKCGSVEKHIEGRTVVADVLAKFERYVVIYICLNAFCPSMTYAHRQACSDWVVGEAVTMHRSLFVTLLFCDIRGV